MLGNLFDIGWKANRRNYALLTGALADSGSAGQESWLFIAGICVVLAALVLVPMLLLGWLLVHVRATLR